MKKTTTPMQKLEEFIYSVKYLPPILYFGPVGLFGYDIYCKVINETEFLNVYTETPLIISFCLMTYLGAKKYQNKSYLIKIK
jgi:hypothetical protein